MRKIVLYLVSACMLFLLIGVSGCGVESKQAANSPAENVAPDNKTNHVQQNFFQLTIDDIKKKYTDEKILNINQFKPEYVLVESMVPTVGNKFDLYNLQTGEVDTLPKRPFGTASLVEIINENYFVFLSDGNDSDGPFRKFPYLIKCIRLKNEYGNFIALYEDKFFSLDTSVRAGSKEGSVMSEVNVTFDGLEILFKPDKDKETGFYADFTDIPPTKISYDKAKSQMIFEIKTSQLSEKLKGIKKVNLEDNQFMSSYEIIQKDNMLFLVIGIRDLTKEYTAKIKRLPEGQLPYLSIFFREKQE